MMPVTGSMSAALKLGPSLASMAPGTWQGCLKRPVMAPAGDDCPGYQRHRARRAAFHSAVYAYAALGAASACRPASPARFLCADSSHGVVLTMLPCRLQLYAPAFLDHLVPKAWGGRCPSQDQNAREQLPAAGAVAKLQNRFGRCITAVGGFDITHQIERLRVRWGGSVAVDA